MSYTDDMGKKLNELLEKNYDAEAGYKNAAEKVQNSALKNYLLSRAQDRYDFGHELKTELSNLGQEPDKGTSLAGDAHRLWMDLKTALTSDKDEAVLEEAIRGEKTALEEYNEIIKNGELPLSTTNIIAKQRDSVQNALTEAKALETLA
ncbi:MULTISPECIES: ferritin-like domain-containing protein [unclassified Leeuwenhoekiella]|uniref:ferritin-like domain-containing protein n=1 Tax=unclassified Leeuwenhoekiella TaxID=2615029 RepID=UPI00048AD276|nr:PA2169 family four-helix-bundle protein [Leeuwenhoekiella sp. MAR_2009_132]